MFSILKLKCISVFFFDFHICFLNFVYIKFSNLIFFLKKPVINIKNTEKFTRNLQEIFASYVGRERINGTVLVLFKTRLCKEASCFLPINGLNVNFFKNDACSNDISLWVNLL